MRKIYLHEGNGHWIGSHIVVAGNKKKAEAMIRSELDLHGLTEEKLNIKEFGCDKSQVVLSDGGEY